MSIRILVTGGTFDKEYDELTGTLFFKETHIHEMLRLGRCRVPVTVETIMMVDSLEMADDGPPADRGRLPARARGPDRDHARHGHDGGDRGRPRARKDGQDDHPDGRDGPVGVRQLGRPLQPRERDLASSRCSRTGVYVAMNGRCFKWDDVRKDRTTGTFETVR